MPNSLTSNSTSCASVSRLLPKRCQNLRILDEEAYPSLAARDGDSSSKKDELNIFRNLHEFAVMLHTKRLSSSLVPAAKSFDAYFGPKPVREAETFYAVTRWLTCAHEEIYQASPDFQKHWASWYMELCRSTAAYGKKNDKESLRLAISGRAAQKRMEVLDPRIAAFDKAVREGLQEAMATDSPTKENPTLIAAKNAVLLEEAIKKLADQQLAANLDSPHMNS
jgi:hypothetical protein